MSFVVKFLFALCGSLLPITSSIYAEPISCEPGSQTRCGDCSARSVFCRSSDSNRTAEGYINEATTPVKRMKVTILDINKRPLRVVDIPDPPGTSVADAYFSNFNDEVLEMLRLKAGRELAIVERGGLFLDDSTVVYEDYNGVRNERGGRTIRSILGSSGTAREPCTYVDEPQTIRYESRSGRHDPCANCRRALCVGTVSCENHPVKGDVPPGTMVACDALDVNGNIGCPTATECGDDLEVFFIEPVAVPNLRNRRYYNGVQDTGPEATTR